HYSDIPFDDFTRRVGIRTENQPMDSRVGDAFIGNEASVRGDPQLGAAIEQRRQTALAQEPNAPTIFRRMLIGHQNNQMGAVQGVNPDTSHYGAPIATDASQNPMTPGEGPFSFNDPATGQGRQVDPSRHVLLLDPTTGRPNVYARNPDLAENRLSSIARIM